MSYMIEIKSINDIPEYLHGSDLFKNIANMNGDDNSSFAVPCHNLKKNDTITSDQGFFYTYRTCIYWGLNEFPYSIFNHIYEMSFKHFNGLKKTMIRIGIEPYYIKIFELINSIKNFENYSSGNEVYKTISECNNIGVLKFFQKRKILKNQKNNPTSLNFIDSPQLGIEMVSSGNIECLKYLKSIGYKFVKNHYTIRSALELGCLKTIKFVLDDLECQVDNMSLKRTTRIPASLDALDCLEFIHKKGFLLSPDTVYAACEKGSLRCLKYAIQNGCTYDYKEAVKKVLENGSIECFEYLFESSSCDEKTFCETRFASKFSTELFLHVFNKGCHLSYDGCELLNAAKTSNFELMKFLIQNNITIDKKVLTYSCIGYGPNQFDCLKLSYDCGAEINPYCLISISQTGNLDSLIFCYEKLKNNLTDTQKNDILNNLILRSKIDCIEYLLSNGFVLKKSHLSRSAGSNEKTIACTEYIYNIVKEWDSEFMAEAARCDRLDKIKYAFERGCPWHSLVTNHAARNNNLEIIIYAYENNCPWHERTALEAYNSKNYRILEFVTNAGAIFNSFEEEQDY